MIPHLPHLRDWERSIEEKAKKATHIARGDGDLWYRPRFEAGGTPILPAPLFNVPMSKMDFEFYDEGRTAVPKLLEALSEARGALQYLARVCQMECEAAEEAPVTGGFSIDHVRVALETIEGKLSG